MQRTGWLLAAMLLVPTPLLAQDASAHHDHHGMAHEADIPAPARKPSQPGQAAFAAIQEIVEILEADPKTDWSKVNIEALRQHLIDMDAVTLHSKVTSGQIESGMRFDVTGEGSVRDSIRRMVHAHAAAMEGVDGWHFNATDIENGARLAVVVPQKDLAEIQALGFIGVLTRGMHHQAHHLAIARGEHPHG